MNIHLEGIVAIVGNYGSGKTEVSINLALDRRRAGMRVRLADLDLVNPYFRTREARKMLSENGVEVILPPDEYLAADLPILSPVIAGMIRNPGQLDLLDAGGDPVGAKVLSTLADAFIDRDFHMLQVVNPMRPKTDTIGGCLELRNEIESAARSTVTGWIGNAHLMDDTRPDDIVQGYKFLQALSCESGLPVMFVTCPGYLLDRIAQYNFSCPVLAIDRQLVPPWKKSQSIS